MYREIYSTDRRFHMILRAKKYVAALLVFVCVCMIFSPLTAYAAEDSSQHETVKVGFFAMDGYHVMDEEGNRSGYGYDFLRLMARYWDVDYEYVGYDKSWDDMQQMLEDGEIDMVTSPRKTPEREEKFDFSRPIGTNNGILTVRSDNSTIVDGNYSTYNGMRVAFLNGSSRDLAAQYTTYKATELTFVDWIRLHPVVTVLVLLIFGWLLTAMAVTMVHLSARKKAQKAAQEKAEEMAELAEHAQAANKAKTAFLSHMSHDMRTPMNAIMGFTSIAMKNNPSDEVKNCLEKIDESSEYLLSLINDVLDLTHIESGKVKYDPVPADVKNITDSALDIIKGFLTNRDINFKIQREDAKIPNVLADPARLRDVLVNILSNAVKFTPDGGTITFEARCQEKGGDGYINMRYRISDTGIGMSEEFTKEIFEEFAQEDSDVRTQYHGVGLGMAIVKKYVDMMGGTISVQSKKHEGTTFTVDIPLEITDKECNKSDTGFSEKVNLTGVNVLLAEDNELNAEIATVQLEEFGMKVERAVDGKNAVEIFRNHPKGTFDVILMDVMMPEMNGYEATKAIRAMNDRPDGKNIPIIAMTANSFAEDVQASLDAGMNAHLSKPIVIDEVIKTILRYVL